MFIACCNIMTTDNFERRKMTVKDKFKVRLKEIYRLADAIEGEKKT